MPGHVDYCHYMAMCIPICKLAVFKPRLQCFQNNYLDTIWFQPFCVVVLMELIPMLHLYTKFDFI